MRLSGRLLRAGMQTGYIVPLAMQVLIKLQSASLYLLQIYNRFMTLQWKMTSGLRSSALRLR